MREEHRYRIALATSLVVLAYLVWRTFAAPPDSIGLLPGFLFGILIVFTATFSIALGEGQASLLPMTVIASYLVVGPVLTGWVSFVGMVVFGFIRYRWAEALGIPVRPGRMRLVGLTAANAALHTISILVGDAVFRLVGGVTPLNELSLSHLLPLVLLGVTSLVVNHLLVIAFISMRGRASLRLHLRALPNALLYEGAPLIFAPLVALVYIRLGLVQFVLFAMVLIIASLITHDLARTSRRLGRRVQELDSLQAVGQALSASLDPETILQAIYTQVSRLMPARNFYVALYDPETDEVSFPLSVENGEQVRWPSRRMGRGLTEHVLQTGKPVLIRSDVAATLQELGVEQIGRPAASWLGVPMLAEAEPLGVIAVQSYSIAELYDTSHQEVLVTIAAQASVAIQNARLYTRTDKALARRVQELDSILHTTYEGILLLDPDWRVLAANRALANFVGIAQLELEEHPLDVSGTGGEQSLIALIGYRMADLEADCQALAQAESVSKKEIVTLPGPPERQVERTLTPVRDQDGVITGWLLVFRDLTEERDLERLRDDMTHMLVHDLRSPLTVMQGSLDMIEMSLNAGSAEEIEELLGLARSGNDRLLRMIGELLDISKLESGNMTINPRAVDVEPLLQKTKTRLAPLADIANISVEISTGPGLPQLYVDAKLFGRVLNNLLDNAIKFTPDGGRVQLWARPDSEGDLATVLVGVSDEGPGIPEEEQHRLFKKFQQIATTSGRRRGTGLGLSFCKLAVEAHNGQIWVESEAGEGSSFVMRLPAAV